GNFFQYASGGGYVYDGGIYKFDKNFTLIGHWLDAVDVDTLSMTSDQHTVLFSAGGLWGARDPRAIDSLDLNTNADAAFATGDVQIGGTRILPNGRVLATDWSDVKLF